MAFITAFYGIYYSILWHLLQHFMRRLKKAYGRRNLEAAARIQRNKPKYKLDHVVKERCSIIRVQGCGNSKI